MTWLEYIFGLCIYAEFLLHLQILLHTPGKKPANRNCTTQHLHLVTRISTRDEDKQRGEDSVPEVLAAPLYDKNPEATALTQQPVPLNTILA